MSSQSYPDPWVMAPLRRAVGLRVAAVAIVLLCGSAVYAAEAFGLECLDGVPCDDGDACTVGDTCQSGVCTGAPVPCPACEACDPSAGCVAVPRTACRASTMPESTRLTLRNWPRDDRDRIVWKWRRGEETPIAAFGSPVTSTAYAFCIYDESGVEPHVLFRASVPPGGQCGSKPCWHATGGTGFKYRDGVGASDGVTKLQLYSGGPGHARIIAKGSGVQLTMPALPLPLPLRVQVQADGGSCWEARYLSQGVVENDAAQFHGKASTP